MSKTEINYFYAKSLSELFFNIKNVKDIQVIGGGTQLTSLAERVVSVNSTPELKKISKHERYIDFGPAITLNELLNLGKNHLPSIIYEALETIANPFVRNLATLGGNILSKGMKHTLFAPLAVIDTKLEVKTESETTYVPLVSFEGLKEGQILSNVRIPLTDWDIQLFYRVGPENKITEESASFAFVGLSEKNIITTMKICFAGKVVFRSHEFESKFIGLKLPLTDKYIETILEEAETYFDKATLGIQYNPLLKHQFLNLLHTSLEHLT